jgi:hypothetical protein
MELDTKTDRLTDRQSQCDSDSDEYLTCLYATDRKEGFVVRKLQRGLSSMETRCERWNIKINEDKTRGIYFSRSLRQPGSHLTLNVRNIPFVNSVKYLGVIFDKKDTWRTFRSLIRIYSLFISERLSTNIILTLRKAFVRSIMTCACPAWEFAADNRLRKLQRLQNKVLRTIAHPFAICIWLSNSRIHIIL